jgi:hypothetical protein
MRAGLGGSANAQSWNRGALRRTGVLCLVGSRHHAGWAGAGMSISEKVSTWVYIATDAAIVGAIAWYVALKAGALMRSGGTPTTRSSRPPFQSAAEAGTARQGRGFRAG